MSIENLKTFDPFAEADEDTGQVKQSQQDYIHIRIQRTLPHVLVQALASSSASLFASHAHVLPLPYLPTSLLPAPSMYTH